MLEILLVVGAISILAGIVIVAINPGKQLQDARNTARQVDTHTIANAIYQYTLDHDGVPPTGLTSTLRLLGTDQSGCAVSCTGTGGAEAPGTYSFIDNNENTFSGGIFAGTSFNQTNNTVKLSGGSSGSFISTAKDSGINNLVWNVFTPTPFGPYGKELPNLKQSETAYSAGNANMAANNFLGHLNGTIPATGFYLANGFTVWSNSAVPPGSQEAGCKPASQCPSTVAGKFSTAADFDGVNDFIDVDDRALVNQRASGMTFSAWIKPRAAPAANSGFMAIVGGAPNASWNNYGSGGIYLQNNKPSMVVGDRPANITTIYVAQASTAIALNTWHHIAGIYDPTTASPTLKIYVNGQKADEKIVPLISSYTNNFYFSFIGKTGKDSWPWWFNGAIDEVAIFNRPLAAGEVLSLYSRGVSQLKYQVRACADASCAGQNFIGPDGTEGTFFAEAINATPAPFALSNVSGRYLQYKGVFDTENSSYSPELRSAAASGVAPASNGGAVSSSSTSSNICLDLSTDLADYITSLPNDPKAGSAGKTFYAAARSDKGRITVKACQSETSEAISAQR